MWDKATERRISARQAGWAVAPANAAGIPMSGNLTTAKVFEAREAIAARAREIEMVLAIGLLSRAAPTHHLPGRSRP